jgi:hypothetical protein
MNIKWSTEVILKHASQFNWQNNVQHVLEKMDES